MKLYIHLSVEGFCNSYIVGNDETREAVFIDPGYVDSLMISHIEENNYTPCGILITHSHKYQTAGVKTLLKIYKMPIISADNEIAGTRTNIISGEGILRLGSFDVEYFSTPGHSPDSMLYKISSMLFTGDALSPDCLGSTNSMYAEEILRNTVRTCLESQKRNLLVFPAKGPPSTLEAELKYNLELQKNILQEEKYLERDY